jgi:hypothetical protein
LLTEKGLATQGERLSDVHEGALGRTLTCDSMSFVDATVRATDTVPVSLAKHQT